MPKPRGTKPPVTTIPTGSVAVFEEDASAYAPAEPEYAPPQPPAGRAAAWRAFLQQYARPIPDSPGWFAGACADGDCPERANFRVELLGFGQPRELTATEVNPSGDDLLLLRTRRPVRGDGEEVTTSAVPWEQVGQVTVLG